MRSSSPDFGSRLDAGPGGSTPTKWHFSTSGLLWVGVPGLSPLLPLSPLVVTLIPHLVEGFSGGGGWGFAGEERMSWTDGTVRQRGSNNSRQQVSNHMQRRTSQAV